MILATWIGTWAETPSLWVFIGIWGLNVWAGSWRAFRAGERLDQRKVVDGLDLLHKGLLALFGIHLMQQAQLDSLPAVVLVTGTAIGLQGYVIVPLFLTLLRNTGHLPAVRRPA